MNTTTNINILNRRKQDGEHLADHEEYALHIARTLSEIISSEYITCFEYLTLYEYLADCLDIEYRVGSQHEYRSVKIAITLGGPACYIDTDLQAVVCVWWSGTCACEYGRTYNERDAITSEIDTIFAELHDQIAA